MRRLSVSYTITRVGVYYLHLRWNNLSHYDEASTCFERQRAEDCAQQHKDDQVPTQKPANGDA